MRITAMMSLAVVLVSLIALGAVTHFVPPLRNGRIGYPANRSVRQTSAARRATTRLSYGSARRKNPPPTRQLLGTTKPPTGGRGFRRVSAIRR